MTSRFAVQIMHATTQKSIWIDKVRGKTTRKGSAILMNEQLKRDAMLMREKIDAMVGILLDLMTTRLVVNRICSQVHMRMIVMTDIIQTNTTTVVMANGFWYVLDRTTMNTRD